MLIFLKNRVPNGLVLVFVEEPSSNDSCSVFIEYTEPLSLQDFINLGNVPLTVGVLLLILIEKFLEALIDLVFFFGPVVILEGGNVDSTEVERGHSEGL